MSWTKNDKEYLSGWEDGYKKALEGLRAELLEKPNTPIEVFENINKLEKETEK